MHGHLLCCLCLPAISLDALREEGVFSEALAAVVAAGGRGAAHRRPSGRRQVATAVCAAAAAQPTQVTAGRRRDQQLVTSGWPEGSQAGYPAQELGCGHDASS